MTWRIIEDSPLSLSPLCIGFLILHFENSINPASSQPTSNTRKFSVSVPCLLTRFVYATRPARGFSVESQNSLYGIRG